MRGSVVNGQELYSMSEAETEAEVSSMSAAELYSESESAENKTKFYSESESGEKETELYSVSEAVRRTGVPSHVLRYWEDELHLFIRRSAQGHRLYSAEDLVAFRRVKELKEKGIQLKAIRLLLENSEDGKRLEQLFGADPEAVQSKAEPGMQKQYIAVQNEGVMDKREQSKTVPGKASQRETIPDPGGDSKENASRHIGAGKVEYEIIPTSESGNYQRFESMIRSLICEAVAEQNEKLEQDLTELIRDEFDDLYIQLLETAKREAAAAQMNAASTHVKKGVLRRLMNVMKERR
ncbi:MAG: helix-turn-helix domain-containing protein [Lachnospiraceae bacterium]|nr:helix-turn-helix domain-containing protein [Lachnospiraceae bacterium]